MESLKWYHDFHAVSRMMKPYQLNPINIRINYELSEEKDELLVIAEHERDWTRPPINIENGREVEADGFPASPLECPTGMPLAGSRRKAVNNGR